MTAFASEHEAFLKEAGVKSWLLKGLARVGEKAVAAGGKAKTVGRSMGKQMAEGGVKKRAPLINERATGRAVRRAPDSGNLGFARGELGSTDKLTKTRMLKDKGKHRVAKRMAVRGGVGAAAGVGQEALSAKSEGRDFSVGRAIGKGMVGATVGAAAGTTMGKRMLRRTWQNKTTPTASIGQTIKAPGKSIASTQVANFKNLSPLEKGYSAMTAYDVGSAAVGSNPNGDRGARMGGALGEAGALLVGGRWKGMRRPRGGSVMGSLGRQAALFGGTSVAGSAIGGLADKKKAPAVTVAPGSNQIYEQMQRRTR